MLKSVKSIQFGLLLFLLVGLIAACKSESYSESSKDMGSDHLQELEESLKSLKDGNGEVVEISVLKDALPKELLGMKRTSHNGSRSGIAGINIASAEAQYADEDRRVSITLMDAGGLGAAFSSLASWSEIEIDNESDDGYERTTIIDGKKAIEKYNRKTKQGEISLIADDRFIFAVKTSNLSEKEIRKVISKIKIKG